MVGFWGETGEEWAPSQMHLIPKSLSNWFISLFSCLLAHNLRIWNFVHFSFFFFLLPLRTGHLNWTLLFSASILLLSLLVNFSFQWLCFPIAQFFLVLFHTYFSLYWYYLFGGKMFVFYHLVLFTWFPLVLWYFKQLIWSSLFSKSKVWTSLEIVSIDCFLIFLSLFFLVLGFFFLVTTFHGS